MKVQEELGRGSTLRCLLKPRMLLPGRKTLAVYPSYPPCPNFPGPSSSPLFSLLPGYRGHPSFQSLVSKLRSQVMSMARPQLSHTILTEKNW